MSSDGYSPPRDDGPELVYRDESILVANKPAGLLSVPGRGTDKADSLVTRLQLEFPDALIVHRLDMSTSGLMVFARGVQMQRLLSQMFREREMTKRYVAIVSGRVESVEISDSPSGGSIHFPFVLSAARSAVYRSNERETLTANGSVGWSEVNLPIAADWPNRPLRKIDAGAGKPSLTRFKVLSHDANADTCRVELEPVTGRTHQLRVHMAAIGHPILGDVLYSGAAADRLMLHACMLRFVHPASGTPLNFHSAPPF